MLPSLSRGCSSTTVARARRRKGEVVWRAAGRMDDVRVVREREEALLNIDAIVAADEFH